MEREVKKYLIATVAFVAFTVPAFAIDMPDAVNFSDRRITCE
jgi:hypothetical protein